MNHMRRFALAAAALLGSVTMAAAQEAFTTNDANLRAGPGSRFPVVATIPEDSDVYIHGCLSNWDWCDVSWRRSRGWVFSDNLEAVYRSRRVSIYDYRRYNDIPVLSFGFGYWDRHYRDRPWFDEWDRWDDRRDRMRWNEHSNSGDNWNDQDSARMRRTDRQDMQRDDNDNEDMTPPRKHRDRVGDCDGPNPSPSCFDDGQGRSHQMPEMDQ